MMTNRIFLIKYIIAETMTSMARYQFADETDSEEAGWESRTYQISMLVVRAIGVVLLLVGLWIGLRVIGEAWALYDNPDRIQRFAKAVERGSNLDKSLVTASSKQPTSGKESFQYRSDEADAERSDAEQSNLTPSTEFKLSYFAAWAIAILLLMLIGRLAMSAIKTGGELALYDLQLKHLVKGLVQQAASPKK